MSSSPPLPDELAEEFTYTWRSAMHGISLRVPLHFAILDAHSEDRGCALPSFAPAVVFHDKWGELQRLSLVGEEGAEREEDDGGVGGVGAGGDGVLHVMPRTVSLSVRENTEGWDLAEFCRHALRDVLSVPTVTEVDGETDLHRIPVRSKLVAAGAGGLGDGPSFEFSFCSPAPGGAWAGCRVLGCCMEAAASSRLVLMCIRSFSEDVYACLPQYVASVVSLLTRGSKGLCAFERQKKADTDGGFYSAAASADARWRLGEVSYRNAAAAVAFTLPAYAVQFHPGGSLIQAAQRHNLFSLVMQLRLHPAPEAEAEQGSSPEAFYQAQQPVEVSLGIDVEDVMKARNETILSAAAYGGLKMKSVMQGFTNTKPSGTPLTSYIGNRSGVSYLWTGNLSTATTSRVCKAMCCVTLNGNNGVVVSYFTRTGQGLFDMHLHILQQLLQDICFIPEGEADGRFDGAAATTVRLSTEEDFAATFKEDAAADKLARYVALAARSTGGLVPGTVAAPISSLLGTRDAAATPPSGGAKETTTGGAPRRTLRSAGSSGRSAATDDTGSSGGEKAAAAAASAEQNDFVDVSDMAHLNQEAQAHEDSEEAGWGEGDGEGEEDAAAAQEEEDGGEDGGGAGSPGKAEAGSPPLAVGASPVPPVDSEEEESPDSDQVGGGGTEAREGGGGGGLEGTLEVAGANLRQLYARACAGQGAKPNSRLLEMLPTYSASWHCETLDLSLNYFGKAFSAVLRLFDCMPCVTHLVLEDMNLSNGDASALCTAAARLPCLRSLSLRGNPHISLASSKALLKLLKARPTVVELRLEGTSVGDHVIGMLKSEAEANRAALEEAEVEEGKQGAGAGGEGGGVVSPPVS